MSIAFFIPCLPPRATAQGKGVFIAGGKPRFFKRAPQKAAEHTLLALLQPHAPRTPMDGPLCLVLRFRFPWRKGERKAVLAQFSEVPISTRPDVDNLAKGLLDVMTSLRFWNDDAQIASLSVAKYHGDTPGIAVSLTSALGALRDGGMAEHTNFIK